MKRHLQHMQTRKLAGIVLGVILLPLVILGVVQGISSASVEGETGTPSGQVTTSSDSMASKGNYAQFTSSSGGTITLPTGGTWTNLSGNLASGNDDGWSHLFAPPTGSRVYVAQASSFQGTGIYYGTGGTTWTKTGTGTGSADPNTMAQQFVYDPNDVNKIWVSGIYGSGNNFKTTDGGTTWTSFPQGHSDGISVDFSDPNRQTILVGQHESRPNPMVFKSTNGGQSFTSIASNLPANAIFTQDPYVVSANTYLIGVFTSWGGGQPGIYRTTNGGTSWTKVAPNVAVGYAFTAGNALYWSASDWNGSDGVNRSTDGGVTWSHNGEGSGLLRDGQAIGLTDGKLIAIPQDGTRLLTSSNGGVNWTQFGTAFPCKPGSVAYSAGQDAVYISSGDCGKNVWRLK